MPSLIGYRKFIVAVACWASTSLLCAAGLVDGGQYVTAVGLIVALYGAGNVAARALPAGQGGD